MGRCTRGSSCRFSHVGAWAAAQPAGDEQETFDAPLAAIGDAKEGDTISVKVVSRDEQGGTATLTMATDEAEPAGGTQGMADEFQSPQTMQSS